MSEDSSGGGGCGGCLIFIIAFVCVWAICCGVTYKGKHYELECSCDKGVEIQEDK